MIKGKEKGITLVALIITIIVMIILVSITITTAVNQGIIGTAKKATKDYEKGTLYLALSTILLEERSLYENGFISREKMIENIRASIENNQEIQKLRTS